VLPSATHMNSNHPHDRPAGKCNSCQPKRSSSSQPDAPSIAALHDVWRRRLAWQQLLRTPQIALVPVSLIVVQRVRDCQASILLCDAQALLLVGGAVGSREVAKDVAKAQRDQAALVAQLEAQTARSLGGPRKPKVAVDRIFAERLARILRMCAR